MFSQIFLTSFVYIISIILAGHFAALVQLGFLMNFKVFGNAVKHGLLCLIYLFNRNLN